MADGASTKRTARCTTILPRGAVRIKWPADVEFDEEEVFVWSILSPDDFNKDVRQPVPIAPPHTPPHRHVQ